MMVTMEQIETAVCGRFGLTPEVLRGRRQNRAIARPRQIAWLLAREMTSLSYPQIGVYFNRDHSTVITGERRVRELMVLKPKLAAYVSECREAVGNMFHDKQISHRSAA